METFESIQKRRSIRHFKDTPVKKEDVKKIIEAGLYAPSTKNCQPWDFEIFTGEKKEEIIRIIEDNFEEPIWIKKGTTQESCRSLREAPVMIIVFNQAPKSGGEDEVMEKSMLTSALVAEALSIGACIENMLLTATSLGLGSLWIGDITTAKRQVEKHLNSKYDVIAAIALGYPNVEVQPKEIPPFDFEL